MISKSTVDWTLYLGIVAMILLLGGVFSIPSSLIQKYLFLSGAILLAIVAYFNKEWMFFVLEIVICIGAVLAFTNVSEFFRYVLLFGAAIIGTFCLISTKKLIKEFWNIISIIGLFLLAAGFATNANTHPLFYGLLLGFGGMLVGSYSFVDYYFKKDNIAIIWFLLNVVFAIPPLLQVISILRI